MTRLLTLTGAGFGQDAIGPRDRLDLVSASQWGMDVRLAPLGRNWAQEVAGD